MPSPPHDALTRLFEERPVLAVEVLRDLLGVDLPADAPATLEDPSFNTRPSHDLKADTAIAVGPPQAPTHCIVVEIQRDKEPEKRRQLPRYAAAEWLQLNCPVTVLVVCPDEKTAAYYGERISTSLPGYEFQARVLGPAHIPVITDPKQVAVRPDLATIGIMAHGRRREVAQAFFLGINQLKLEHAKQYDSYAKVIAPLAIQPFLEEIVKSAELGPGFIATEYFGRGAAEGRKEGEAKGEAKAILLTLSERGLSVSDEARERITTCEDLDQLETWVRRAVTIETTDDLFR
jgi:hypothetical protein